MRPRNGGPIIGLSSFPAIVTARIIRFLGNQGSQPEALFATIRGIDPKYEYEPRISQSQNLALQKLEPIVTENN